MCDKYISYSHVLYEWDQILGKINYDWVFCIEKCLESVFQNFPQICKILKMNKQSRSLTVNKKTDIEIKQERILRILFMHEKTWQIVLSVYFTQKRGTETTKQDVVGYESSRKGT